MIDSDTLAPVQPMAGKPVRKSFGINDRRLRLFLLPLVGFPLPHLAVFYAASVRTILAPLPTRIRIPAALHFRIAMDAILDVFRH